jgi:ketosteroid isomerase-like protein
MPQDNVDVVRAIYAAFARRDEAAMLAHVDDAVRIHARPHHPDVSVYQGHEGFTRFTDSDWEAFEEVTYEPEEFIEKGPYVIVPIRQAGRGKGSDVGIEERIVNVWKLHDGKCVEVRIHSTVAEALEAIRLANH